MNLAFFGGNDVYWKTRWEPSQDGTNTANRTLVCFKDTWADTKIDPVGARQPPGAIRGSATTASAPRTR